MYDIAIIKNNQKITHKIYFYTLTSTKDINSYFYKFYIYITYNYYIILHSICIYLHIYYIYLHIYIIYIIYICFTMICLVEVLFRK